MQPGHWVLDRGPPQMILLPADATKLATFGRAVQAKTARSTEYLPPCMAGVTPLQHAMDALCMLDELDFKERAGAPAYVRQMGTSELAAPRL